jgi:hypothetical protein
VKDLAQRSFVGTNGARSRDGGRTPAAARTQLRSDAVRSPRLKGITAPKTDGWKEGRDCIPACVAYRSMQRASKRRGARRARRGQENGDEAVRDRPKDRATSARP